jgi:hypothetical protein
MRKTPVIQEAPAIERRENLLATFACRAMA